VRVDQEFQTLKGFYHGPKRCKRPGARLTAGSEFPYNTRFRPDPEFFLEGQSK
jgi:hypothetical protein